MSDTSDLPTRERTFVQRMAMARNAMAKSASNITRATDTIVVPERIHSDIVMLMQANTANP
jgi:hypothetical protein